MSERGQSKISVSDSDEDQQNYKKQEVQQKYSKAQQGQQEKNEDSEHEYNLSIVSPSSFEKNHVPQKISLATQRQEREEETDQKGKKQSREYLNDENQNENEENHVEYPLLKPSSSSFQSQKNLDYEQMTGQNSKSLLINIEENQAIPSIELQQSPKGQKSIVVKILMYDVSTFMKMQTQIFVVDVINPNNHEQYQINRRYSDFVSFYESLVYNQLGYILPPFPEKTFDSFFKLKLGLGSNYEGQKAELIEKRMLQLQKFTNYIASHPQLSNSQELAIFLEKNKQKYEKGKRRLQKYVQQYQNLQNEGQIKKIMEKSSQFITSYLKKDKIFETSKISLGKNDLQFGIILQKVRCEKAKQQDFLKNTLSLKQIQKNFGQFTGIETDNDNLLEISAKQTSGREYCLKFSTFLENSIIENIQYSIRCLQEVEKNLQYRLEIINVDNEANNRGEREKHLKLRRRIERFERNFTRQWEKFFTNLQKDFIKLSDLLSLQWINYKHSMKKIWKQK